ncbi:hypothetical protein BJV74DRAFT_882978 [Russula compacta]|nr:hypothetical protein BJV74DRAFT_882978 [Russula compacta]
MMRHPSNFVFNSFHVTFIKHLDAQPNDLLPGTTVSLDPNVPPSWETPSPDLFPCPPTSPPSTIPHFTSAGPYIPHPATTLMPPLNQPPLPDAPAIAPLSSTLPPVPTFPPSSPPLPYPAPLHCSEWLAAKSQALTTAFLNEFSPLVTSHSLLPLSLPDDSISVDHVLSALTDGSLAPAIDDKPCWADALASDHEFWITGAHEEINSLQDLQVFALIPHSEVPSN